MDFKSGLLVITLLVGVNGLREPSSSRIVPFIAGGDKVPDATDPYVVALTSGAVIRGLVCGGSLISTRTILTAAHCIESVYKNNALFKSLRAVVGTNRWRRGGTAYTLASNVTHPDYVRSTYKNDIGILITSNAVVLNHLVSTVPLTFDYIDEGVRCRVTGWGETGEDAYESSVLLQVNLVTIGNKDCEERLARAPEKDKATSSVDTTIEVCTLSPRGVGTCTGDSGGALRRVSDGHQFGIVSWGIKCARGFPDVFTRISAYKSWLEANIVQ